MKYLFGPVSSRRLGRSLGIDLFPYKICNFQCGYCEVGPTEVLTQQRDLYSSTEEILSELDAFCADPANLSAVDVLTVTAKGEPTLHLGLGEILCHARALSSKPLVVLTNGSTLMRADVRTELQWADIVAPSLDSARESSFTAIDRPAPGLELTAIIAGLIRFSHEFGGQIWLEILLVRDVNDSDADLQALLAVLKQMRLDRVQLNTVIRPPADPATHPVPTERLALFARVLRDQLAVPVDLPSPRSPAVVESGKAQLAQVQCANLSSHSTVERILQLVQRRPCTAADIDRVFQLGGPKQVEQLLAALVASGILHLREHGPERYYH